MGLLAVIVHRFFQLLVLLVIVYVILGYFMNPYHPIRLWLARIVEPMLQPIRRILPQTGMIDFSPLVLLILFQILDYLITRILLSFS